MLRNSVNAGQNFRKKQLRDLQQ